MSEAEHTIHIPGGAEYKKQIHFIQMYKESVKEYFFEFLEAKVEILGKFNRIQINMTKNGIAQMHFEQ